MDHRPNQFNELLRVLGYKNGELVYLRYINPVTGRAKKTQLTYPLTHLPEYKGYNTFFVVNGQGHKAKDIKFGKALFCEFDDMPLNKQLDFWKDYGLPKPSIQIYSGGRSIHHYWVFDKPVPIKDWKKLTADLIDWVGADKANKDPSRILRVPDCKYYSKSSDKQVGNSSIVEEGLE